MLVSSRFRAASSSVMSGQYLFRWTFMTIPDEITPVTVTASSCERGGLDREIDLVGNTELHLIVVAVIAVIIVVILEH